MIALRMRFLAGRFHATPWLRQVNEGAVEWPPSSWRLLRALVAVYYRVRPDGVTESTLERLVDALSSPPHFRLPDATSAHLRHYDAANGGIKFFDAFVALDPASTLDWIWPDASLDEPDRSALAELVSALNSFGRAESWCEVELLTGAGDLDVNCTPLGESGLFAGGEPVRVLVPAARGSELLEALRIETAAMRGAKMLEPSGARWVVYWRNADALSVRKADVTRRVRRPTVTAARYVLASSVLPLVVDALPFCERVRRALIRERVDTEHSEAITGKTADSVALKGHTHAHYFATDEDADGRLDHLTIFAARGFDPSDVAALGAIRTIFGRGNRPHTSLVLSALGTPETVGSVDAFGAASVWRSATPFSLPRFANRGAGKPARNRDLPEAQLRRELAVRGFPDPIRVERVDSYAVQGRPPVRWLEFHARRHNGDRGHGVAGFEIEFPTPVVGPISLGFGCHFGLGLFLPVPGR